MRTLEPQENDETKLVAVFDIENFTAPIGRVSECFMKLEVIDDDYKRFLKNPPTWHSNESILPDEITVPDILRDANYKAMLQIHITFDNENVSSLTGKPSEIIYKCPGEVSIKLIQKVFDYTRNNTIWRVQDSSSPKNSSPDSSSRVSSYPEQFIPKTVHTGTVHTLGQFIP